MRIDLEKNYVKSNNVHPNNVNLVIFFREIKGNPMRKVQFRKKLRQIK